MCEWPLADLTKSCWTESIRSGGSRLGCKEIELAGARALALGLETLRLKVLAALTAISPPQRQPWTHLTCRSEDNGEKTYLLLPSSHWRKN